MTNLIFSQKVLNWFHFFGRKTLPWQNNKNPYTVWISEVMLQQTQVKTVIPYYYKFIKQFPDINILANSSLDTILNLWSGLGYYIRARNIYKTANIIQKNFSGVFPNNFTDIIKLPGIGRTTAGAILSFGFNIYSCILDGNIKRILQRYYSINILNNNCMEKKLWNTIELITPIHNTSKFNQGVMDIGALICTKNNPKCHICPLNNTCMSYLNKTVSALTFLKNNKKKLILKQKRWFLILQYKHFIFLTREKNSKIWKELFCFPQFFKKQDINHWIKMNNLIILEKKILQKIEHKLSHITLNIIPIWIKLHQKLIISNKNCNIWYNLKDPQYVGLPIPVLNILIEIKLSKKNHTQDNIK